MEYISVEEFLKQPKEVQEVFLNWWNPSEGDLFIFDANKPNLKECVLYSSGKLINGINDTYDKDKCIPMFSEGQTRKFVEDKTDSKLETLYLQTGYSIRLSKNNPEGKNITYSKLGENLLQAYFKVAIEIAKEGVENETK